MSLPIKENVPALGCRVQAVVLNPPVVPLLDVVHAVQFLSARVRAVFRNVVPLLDVVHAVQLLSARVRAVFRNAVPLLDVVRAVQLLFVRVPAVYQAVVCQEAAAMLMVVVRRAEPLAHPSVSAATKESAAVRRTAKRLLN